MGNEAEKKAEDQDPDFEQILDDGDLIPEANEPEELSPLEQEAHDMGHTSKEEWTEAGKDPDRWKSPHEYIEYGRLNNALSANKAAMDRMEENFDQRLTNLNKLHDQQIEDTKKGLRAEQRKAVDDADPEAYDAAQNKIEALEKVETAADPAMPQKDPAIIAWESNNAWSQNPDDPKLQAANGFFAAYLNKNPQATAQQALDYVDEQLKVLTPDNSNRRRDNPSGHERSGGKRQRSGKLSMSDLTQQERQDWQNMGFDLWGNDEKAFLQSVADSRKG